MLNFVFICYRCQHYVVADAVSDPLPWSSDRPGSSELVSISLKFLDQRLEMPYDPHNQNVADPS